MAPASTDLPVRTVATAAATARGMRLRSTGFSGGAIGYLVRLLSVVVLLLSLVTNGCAEQEPGFKASPDDPLLHTVEGKAGAARRDGRDSYLAAYAASHGGDADGNPGSDGGGGGFPGDAGGDGLYPDDLYGAPSPAYGAPSTGYDAPGGPYLEGPYPASSGYGAPLAPAPVYGAPAPAPAPAYGPPYGHHRDHGPLPVLEIATVLKILLKLLIFKMIVKFIAVICLLLFLPSLKAAKASSSGGGGDDGERRTRSLSDAGSTAALDAATATLWGDLMAAERRYQMSAARRR